MDDIKINKKKSSFIVNDNNVLSDDDDLNVRRDQPREFNSEETTSEIGSDDDMLKNMYDSDGSERMGSRSDHTQLSYIDEESDECMRQKSEFLYKLKRLAANGHPPSRMFTMDDKLSRIKGEVERINKEVSMTRGVEFSKQGLLFFTQGLEMMNEKFDPFDLQLTGWSNSVSQDINSYDEVFEELCEKYQTKIDVAPEIKLVMMVFGSAFMFHFSSTFAKKSENISSVMHHPDVMAAVGKAMTEEARKEANSVSKPQRKMKEPDSNIDDLLSSLEVDSDGSDSVKNISLDTPKKKGRPKKEKAKVEEDTKKMIFDI